jgi:prophage maintenance system killer protein
VIALEVADLVVIASRTLELDTETVLDLLEPTAAEHALAQARSGGDRGESDDPAGQAAALLAALLRQPPLRHGNQQVALIAMLQFLALNGWEVDRCEDGCRSRSGGRGRAECCSASATGPGRLSS